MSTEPEPMAWQPMETCPRRPNGGLTEDAWIAYEWGAIWRPKGTYVARDEGLAHVGRVGWLPGNFARADLPPRTGGAEMSVRSGLLHTLGACPRCGGTKVLRLQPSGRPRCAKAKCLTFLSIYDPYPAVPAVAFEDLLSVIDARIAELRSAERPPDMIRVAVSGGIDELTALRRTIEGTRP